MIGVKQAVIAGLGASAVAGGGYGTYYLLKDKTIEDRLNREEFNLIKVSEGYQVAFKELKKSENFINDIKGYGAQITNTSAFVVGGEALSKWCNAKIKESLNVKDVDKLINKVKEYCKVRPLTIGAKLKKTLLTSGWDTKLAALKLAKNIDLLEDLRKKDSTISTLDPQPKDTKAEKALEGWCKENFSKKLIQDEDDKIYDKVDKRCVQ